MSRPPLDALAARIANLPPEKRALLELRLRQKASVDVALAPVIPRRTTDDPAPLSFAQQRLWFLDQLEPESSFYNLPRSIHLEGVLDVEALRKSLRSVLARHEVLRTTITVADGNPVQAAGENVPDSLSIIDLSESPESQRQERMRRILDTEVRRPFDLSRDVMLRTTLVRMGPTEHVLLLVTHHIASDGWSSNVLWQELAQLYASFLRGEPDTLPGLPIRYTDYAVWQREWLQGEVLERQLSYWRAQLQGISILQLPTDRPRPPVQSYSGAKQSAVFPKVLSDQLQSLSRKERVTLFMTLLAAFQTLLHRYTRQDDIVVGSPIAGRSRPETEGLVGMFVNTLVLRSDLSGSPSFRELLNRVREVALGAYEHQDLPFEKLVEELRPTRDLSRSPLFQVLFAHQNAPRKTLDLPGLMVSDIAANNDTATFDLSLYISDESEGLSARFEYNSDLFDDGTITRMLGHFETLLQSVVANPDQRISDLPILTKTEEHQLLVEWNNTKADYPDNRRIHELFEAQVERSPLAVAVVFEDKQLTYRELNTKANQLAHCLQKLGAGPDVLVGICVERSLEMIVGLLGILKAGAAYVPLDPAYPKERLAFVLQDAQASVLLTQQPLLPLPGHKAHVLCLDRDWEDIAQQGVGNPASHGTPDNLAYVIYTSGSTGLPKGVPIPHGAVVNFLNSMHKQPGVDDNDILLAVTTLSFDIAGLELYLPLIVGARVVLASRETAIDGPRLAQKLLVSGATIMQATPATWELLMESGWQGDTHLKILCGGEALPRELANQLLTRCASLWNMYGPTETTIWSAADRVRRDTGPISVGRPIDNTRIYVLDADLHPVPIGVPGELYIGGAGVGRGYLNHAELTAERFIPDPYSPEPGARLYKTGDLARYLPGGSIDVLGRIDYQIKIRGFRIEPGEIEAVLTQCPGVSQAVVLAREDIPGEKQLAAYVTAKPEEFLTVNQLADFLKTKLPGYMVPSAFVFLDELPLTPNGKIDRLALPAPDRSRLASEKGFVAARNHLERQIANLWERTLGIQPVGVTDNFFDLGGYSLLAVRVIGQIEKVFGKRLPVTALFQVPTVEQLARLLRQEIPLARWSSLVPLQPNGSKFPFFWIHGEASDAFLPRYLGPDQPLYGLLHQGHDGKPARYTSVKEIAAHYLSEIRTVQAQGPYFLGGYCFGGMLAFEIAQQLKQQNEPIALLVLLAPSTPRNDRLAHHTNGDAACSSRKGPSFREEWSRHSRNLALLSPRERRSYVLERVKEKIKEWSSKITRPGRERAERIAWKAYLRLGRRIPPFLQSPYILDIYFRAIDNYVPEVYPDRLIIFNPNQRWQTLAAGGVEMHEVPGSHTDVLKEPHVRVWAEGLKKYLQEAQTSTHPGLKPKR